MTSEIDDETESRPDGALDMFDSFEELEDQIYKLAAASRLLKEALGECERDVGVIDYLAEEILDRAAALRENFVRVHRLAFEDHRRLRTVPTALV